MAVYVSRERRPTIPHRYKGGALNTLVCILQIWSFVSYFHLWISHVYDLCLQLRVSGLFSNGPYVLVVDCDMYCNDPSSAKQAMCFFLDPETSKDVAFVQFPQMFHNLSKKDIYDSQTRRAFTVNKHKNPFSFFHFITCLCCFDQFYNLSLWLVLDIVARNGWTKRARSCW